MPSGKATVGVPRPLSATDWRFWTLGVKRVLGSPLIRRIALIIFLVILGAEIVIFVPSFFKKREDLAHRLIDSSLQTMQLTRDLLEAGTTPEQIARALLRHPEIEGVTVLDGTGRVSGYLGEPSETDWSMAGARGDAHNNFLHIGGTRIEIFVEAGRPFRNFVRTHLRPDGKRVHVAISGHPVFDDSGNFKGYRGAGTEVTALIEAERALQESQQLLGAIIDHIPAPFTITLKDRNGQYVLVNQHFCERRERSIDDVLGKTTEELYPPDVAERIIAQDNEILRNQKPKAYEFDSVGPKGSIDTFSTVRFPVLDTQGVVMGIGAVNLNISERKRFETELAAAKLHAEQALSDLQATQANLIEAEKLASLGQITAGIAHEIKNPLNFICNFSELSLELMQEFGELSSQVRSHLETDTQNDFDELFENLLGNLSKISEHGRRADDIVKGMLMHSRGEVGGAELCDVVSVVEEAVNLAWHGARAQTPGIEVRIERDFDNATGEAEISRQQISRVVINLVSNALHAVQTRGSKNEPDYKPVISVQTRDHRESVEISVIDNGVGITAEAKSKLFQPFFTTKPPGEGTGLGLSLSYDIVVHQHGGGMYVESTAGERSLFRVVLPRRRIPPKDVDQ